MPQIRIAFLDDHPAVRAGLEAVVEPQPDLVSTGAAANDHELWPLLYRTQPDIVVLDYHHPGRDGLSLSLRIKTTLPAPGVVLYSASADEMAVPATVAGVDGIVDKTSSVQDLLGVVRAVHRGERVLPAISIQRRRESAARLDSADHAILAMRLAGTPPAEIADTLGLTTAQLAQRAAGMFRVLTSAEAPRRSSRRPLPAPKLVQVS